MPYKKLFVPVIEENDISTGLNSALTLAKKFGCHVAAHHIRENFALDPSIRFYPLSMEAVERTRSEHVKLCNDRAQELRGAFEELCEQHKFDITLLNRIKTDDPTTASWTDMEAPLPSGMSHAAKVSDLIILSRPPEEELGQRLGLFETLLLESGKPIFLAPPDTEPSIPSKVLVCWNGSMEAARTVNLAIPLLAAARDVTVLTVDKVHEGAPEPDAATDYLQRHEVNAVSDKISKSDDGNGAQILSYAKKMDADLIVMGGYSHSRVWEVIFGGVTNHVLHHAELPLLICH